MCSATPSSAIPRSSAAARYRSALRRGEVPLRRRVVLVEAQVGVVVGQHSRLSATARSCGVVTLKFAAGDSTTRTLPPARSTSQASSVACARTLVRHVERAPEHRHAERLRRLDRPQPRAVVGADDGAVGAGLLDRVGHARGGDRRVGVLEPGQRRAEQLRRDERPGGVVDGHRLDVAGRGERVADRRGPGRAALDEREPERERGGVRASASSAAAPWPGGTATTARGTPAAAIARSDHATIGRPARATNAFGRPAPSRSPLPAATTIAAERAIKCSDARAGGRTGPRIVRRSRGFLRRRPPGSRG